jgi:hypothetical protein
MAVRQVISCPWQDEQGNVLALGKIVFEASGDALVSGSGELCAGIKGSLSLDSNGQVAASPAQYMWPTDQMAPSGITYTVWVYSAEGELAWGPNYNLTVPSGAGSFNICAWTPNSTGGSSGGNTGGITLQTNGVNNPSQIIENLIAGTNITLTADDAGGTTIASSGSSGPRSRYWHGWSYAGQAGFEPTAGYGCTPALQVAGAYTQLEPTATQANLLGFGTGSAGGSISAILDNVSGATDDSSFTLGILGVNEHRCLLGSTALVRYWIGFQQGATSGLNFWKSDTPAEPTVAFRYSTAAGDTHWQCVVTDGTTQVVVATTVAPDATTVHTYAIAFDGVNSVLFYIDGTLVGTVSITTTTLTTASKWGGFTTVDNVGAANNKILYIEGFYWDTTP